MPSIDDTDDASKILETARAAVVEGENIVQKAREDHGLDKPLDDDGPLTRAWNQHDPSAEPPPPSAMSPTLTEMIGHIVDYERAGRRVAVGLGLTRLRERYEGLDPEDLPPDEQSWEAFVAKHLPLPAERIAELIGKMVHHGGVLHCTKCGTKSKCGCGCGAPYVGDHRWAIPIAKVEPTKKPSALDRAAVAIAAHPDKSDRAIAAEIGMDHKTVAKARRAMAVSPLDSPPEKRVGRDGRSYPVTTRAIPPTKRGNAG